MNRIAMGDVVQLKSGGRKMLASEYRDGDQIQCIWIEDETFLAETFAEAALTIIQPSDETPNAIA